MNNKINFTILTKQGKTLLWSFEEIETKRDDYGNMYYIEYTMPSGDVFLIDCRYIKNYDFRKTCIDFLINFYGNRMEKISEIEKEEKKPSKFLEIYVDKYWNYSASELMYLYSKNNPSVQFERDKYMNSTLTIEGKKYKCQSWSITPDKDNEDYDKVSIYLEEVTQ